MDNYISIKDTTKKQKYSSKMVDFKNKYEVKLLSIAFPQRRNPALTLICSICLPSCFGISGRKLKRVRQNTGHILLIVYMPFTDLTSFYDIVK
jgi:hypothetical protein